VVVIASLHLNRALVCGLLQLEFQRLIFWLLQAVVVVVVVTPEVEVQVDL
jgi:hypothetical protein